jgi:hypothetical protein
MAPNHSWSRTISFIQRDVPLNRQHGFAQLVDGRVFYSPNSNRKIAALPFILDPKDLKSFVSRIQVPYWWSPRLAYLPFIPLDPQYTNSVPFQDLAFIPHQSTSSAEGKHMLPDMRSKWERLENALSKATHMLLARLNVQGEPPPPPNTLGYKAAHLIVRHLREALTTSRDCFSLWIGALAFAIALSDFMEPRQNDAIPGWYSALRDAGLDEVWVDGVRTSPMMRFDGSALRVGVIMDILSPKEIQASVDWLCNFNVPVWYPWGTAEAAAARSDPNIARLAPHAYQLQSVSSSFFTKEVGNTYQVTQHGSQPRTNKRPFEVIGDEVRIGKRPRQEPQASNESDPWGASSSAITWTTNEPNPWGTGSWPVSPEPASNRTTTSDLGQEQPIQQPQSSLSKGVASYEPFFARRRERKERALESESAKDKQKRENRERVPPKSKVMIFEWKKDADNLYTRVRVTKSEYEDCFERHGKNQRRYDSFYNEWDMCTDFGVLDASDIAALDEEDDIYGPARAMHKTPNPPPETTAKISGLDVSSISQPDPDAPILSQPDSSVGVQGASVSHTVGETAAPSPGTNDAVSMSLVETPATSVVPTVPQVDPSVPFSGGGQVDFSVGDRGMAVSHTGGETAAPSPRTDDAASMSLVEAPPATAVEAMPQVNRSVPFLEGVCYQDQTDASQNQDEGLLPKPERPSESELDSSVGRREMSVSHSGGETESPSQSSDGAEVLSAMSVVPAIPMDVSQDEGSAEKRLQVPGSDFSWPAPPSLIALLTASEEASGPEPRDVDEGLLQEIRPQVPDFDFSWPISSALMALASASEEDIGHCTIDTYNTTSLLHSVYGFIYPNPISPQPAAGTIDGPMRKRLQVSVGLDEDEQEFLQSPLAHPALEFLDCLANVQLSPSPESSDLAEGSLRPLRQADRLRRLRVVGNVYVFDFKCDATLPWMIGVASAAIALYIVRLDPRLNDYEISRHLLHRGIAFHTLLPLRTIPKSPIPDLGTNFHSIRSAGYVFTTRDFDAYINRRDALLRSPRGRAALLKGGIVWRLAVETIGVDECLEGPSIETIVHRRGLLLSTADPKVELCDDDLSIAEVDLICGVYECMTGKLLSFRITASSMIKFL